MQAFRIILTLVTALMVATAIATPVKSILAAREIVNAEEEGGWRNPYPKDGLAYVWSMNMGEEPDTAELFSILTYLYNERIDFTVSIACKYDMIRSSGVNLLVLGRTYSNGPLTMRTRNAGSTDNPNQRPYICYDGVYQWNQWNPFLEMTGCYHLAIAANSYGYSKCMNYRTYGPFQKERTMTVSEEGSTFNVDQIGCILIYARAMTADEMNSLYYIHAHELGWQ